MCASHPLNVVFTLIGGQQILWQLQHWSSCSRSPTSALLAGELQLTGNEETLDLGSLAPVLVVSVERSCEGTNKF